MPSLGRRGDKLNLVIRKGATFGPYTVTMQDSAGALIDLVGATVRATIRKEYGDATAYAVTCEVTGVGVFTITMAPAGTAVIPYLGDFNDPDNQYVWDLEIEYSSGVVQPVFWGTVKIIPEATT